ncbi:hypothetical protein F5B21DRAFT_477932 [Xylaria acuta]|nr:hypothetical protein F5B21DRAFT_477932 [Xylaria acuta]
MDTNLWGRLHTRASEHECKNTEKRRLKDRTRAFDKHQKGVDEADEKREKALNRLERREQKALDDSRSHRVDEKLRKIDQKERRWR